MNSSRRMARLISMNLNALGAANRLPRFRQNSGVATLGESSSQSDIPNQKEAWLFVDSVFPIQLGRWDLRSYIGLIREEILLARLKTHLSTVKTHNFEILSLEPHYKDGGVFVKFNYSAGDQAHALTAIETDLQQHVREHGGLPSWLGISSGTVWLVKGHPWREDMNRFASPIVKVAFEGPDVQEESLYQIFRLYGQIQEISHPTPVSAGNFRSSVITFRRLRSAAIARNVVHGLNFSPTGHPSTMLRTAYQKPIQAHAVRDWISGHPRIVLPVLVFLLGTLTYTIFDPIRALMVEAKISDWLNYKEFAIYKWLLANTVSLRGASTDVNGYQAEEIWRERKDAEDALKKYLCEMPSTVTFVHGPQGSGKTRMLVAMLKEVDRPALVIDCQQLQRASSETRLVEALANQTGYRPVFSFLNSINHMIDLASVGLIGQKAGLSSSLTEQLQQILETVSRGLKGVASSRRSATKREFFQRRQAADLHAVHAARRERIRTGTWHDGRLDCVAGNGIMSELGVGDEMMDTDVERGMVSPALVEHESETEQGKKVREIERARMRDGDFHATNFLPIVVVKNFAGKGRSEDLLNVLVQWVANLTENQIAHVIVLSENRENAKLLAKALPSKPLNMIALYDADASTALSFVKQKLRDGGVELEYTKEQVDYVNRLGGRASDLEILIHKVRAGQRVEEAVEDIIQKGVSELRKNAFGDDIEDSKTLPWTREQAWIVLKQLSKQEEISYYDILSDFPFKSDETPLRQMERADLISIITKNGRPSMIRPGKPVYRYVFERLVGDTVFQATQDISFNEKIIAGAESTLKACEEELITLKEIGTDSPIWWGRSATSRRAAYLSDRMLAAESKIEALVKRNTELKRALSKSA